jgi:radical SAM/Cys-rich protein
MPCFEPENVDAQGGNGVFDASILALQLLNQLGCGRQDDFVLDLVYNQAELESDYKRELKNHFGIDFHRVYTITNMPIARVASWLKRNGNLETYMQLLVELFNPASVAGLLCRNTLSIGWRGEVYDSDFNQQLGMQWKMAARSSSGILILSDWKTDPSLSANTASDAPPAVVPPAAAH